MSNTHSDDTHSDKTHSDDIAAVIEALRGAGLSIGQPSSEHFIDLTASHPQGMVAVEVKRLCAVRIDDLEERLAVGVFEPQKRTTPQAVPMVCVVVDRPGERAQRAAMRFMVRHAPDLAWGLVDRAGGAHLEIPSFGMVFDKAPAAGVRSDKRTDIHLFSDLNRWLLKVLLGLEGSEVLPMEGMEVVMRRFLQAVSLDARLICSVAVSSARRVAGSIGAWDHRMCPRASHVIPA